MVKFNRKYTFMFCTKWGCSKTFLFLISEHSPIQEMNWYLGNTRSLPISTHTKMHRHSFPRLLATALQSCVGSSPIDRFPQVQNPRIILKALTLYLPRVVLPHIAPTPLVRVLTREAWFPPSGISRSNGSSSYPNMRPSLDFSFEWFSSVAALVVGRSRR